RDRSPPRHQRRRRAHSFVSRSTGFASATARLGRLTAMNCEQLHTIVGAEPNSTDPEVLAHIEQCPDCARYRAEMQAMDRLIYRALAVDAPAEKSADQVLSPPSQHGGGRIWRMAA